MAWVRRRTRRDGLVSIAVQWRDVRGKLQSETFRDAAAAGDFLRLVRAAAAAGGVISMVLVLGGLGLNSPSGRTTDGLKGECRLRRLNAEVRD